MKHLLRSFCTCVFILATTGLLQARKTGFAIVTDSLTYLSCQAALKAYASCIEEEGLQVHLLTDNWSRPETLRRALYTLYQNENLEGCVLIGDIPVVMVTHAQHLTSAFKMDERAYPLRECSVPTDRYYDDFDLIFTPIEGQGPDGLLHYYSMAPESPQYIQCDIYSARIKPQKNLGNPYDQINRYLAKAIAAHREENRLDNFISFTGHGSYSGCLTAWASEKHLLEEQFPGVFTRNRNAKFLRYSMEPYMKPALIREMQRPDIDLMVFHEHGDYYRQYLDGETATANTEDHIELIGYALRNQWKRHPQEAAALAAKWGLDSTWYAGANHPEKRLQDSLIDLRDGIILEEIPGIKPNPRMVIFDACYNGDFREDNYIAGHYIFSEGATAICWANSVNVLQDKSSFDLLGLLGLGLRTGLWAQHINILESHLHGDPTLCFTKPATEHRDLNAMATLDDPVFWRTVLADPVADLRCLALIRLYELNDPQITAMLPKTFREDPCDVVHHTAFRLSESLGGPSFKQILTDTYTDRFEFLRRIGITRAGRTGDPDLLPGIEAAKETDRHNVRVIFQVNQALDCFSQDTSLLNRIADRKTPDRRRILFINFLKNKPLNHFVPQFIAILKDPSESDTLRTRMAEALAWFNLSVHKDSIAAACSEMIEQGGMNEELAREVKRCYARLTSLK